MKNKDLNKQFNIPTWVKGDTPSDEAKSIKKRFADRKDKASVETMEELLKAVADKQEYFKMQTSLANEATQVPDQMHGEVPQGMEQFALGGIIGQGLAEGATGAEQADAMGAGIAGIGTAVNLGQTAFGSSGVDTSGRTDVSGQTANQGGMALSGAMQGASAGMALGPVGAAVGGVVGGVAGLIGGGRKKKDLAEAASNNALMQNAQYSKMAYGGYTNDYADGGPMKAQTGGNIMEWMQNFQTAQGNNTEVGPAGSFAAPNAPTVPSTQSPIGSPTGNTAGTTDPTEKTRMGKGLDFLKKNAGNIAQYAPLVGSITDKIDKAPDPRRNQLDARFRPDMADEAALQNIAQNEYGNVSNALRSASGGSGAALRSNLLGASLNKTKALSNSYLQADNINRQQNQIGQQFNLGVDAQNLRQSNLDEADAQANEGAFQTAKSARRSAIYEDIGKIGTEEVNKKLVKEMFGYSWDGKYYRDKSGTIIPNEEVFAKLKASEKETKADSNANMYGGYLKRK